jgi:hypothetical protein
VAGYKVPEDLSTCPDKRYPNHVFTGAQPLSGDERVRHVWEILPSPWVPFTRYDDDLGPIQGRRRAVKNEGQQASLSSDKKISYEGRDGSAIVSLEIEEIWSIKTDEDENSLFPIKDRDFYDPRLGAVKERRQLFVPTGEEKASIEFNDPVVTQIGYEAYNEYLSYKVTTTYTLNGPVRREDVYDPIKGPIERISQIVYDDGSLEGSLVNNGGIITQTSYQPINTLVVDKIVEKYSVSGPQLIGQATDNEKQLVTITTQRKAADGYVPPNPTAIKTVEVSREDAESIIERITETPEIFSAKVFSTERPDPIPEKFRVLIPSTTEQSNIEGTATTPILSSGQISKSEQQVDKFVKRISSTSRNQTLLPRTLTQKTTNNDLQLANITETLQGGDTTEQPTAKKIIQSEALGDGNYVVRKTEIDNVFDSKLLSVQKTDPIPEKFRINSPLNRTEETKEQTTVSIPVLEDRQFLKSEQRLTAHTVQSVTLQREENYEEINNRDLDESWGIQLPFVEYISSTVVTGYNIEVEGLGDGNYLVREYNLDSLESILGGFSIVIPSSADVNTPRVLSDVTIAGWQEEKSLGENEFDSSGLKGSFDSLTQRDNGSISSTLSLVPKIEITFKEYWGNNIPANIHIFFLEKSNLNSGSINSKVGATGNWPVFKPESFIATAYGVSETKTISVGISRAMSFTRNEEIGYQPTTESQTDYKKSLIPVIINIPPCLRSQKILNLTNTLNADSGEIKLNYEGVTTSTGEEFPAVEIIKPISHSISIDDQITIPETNQPDVPKNGKYIISTSVEPYKFNWFLVRAVVFDASVFA